MNRLTYLYQNGYYWSMSPLDFYSSGLAAYEFHQNATGYSAGYLVIGASSFGLRPVINLQSDDMIGSIFIL